MKSEELYLFDLPATCRVSDCGREITNKRERLCDRHYKRLWKYGDPLAGGPARADRGPAQVVVDLPDGTRICNMC